MFDENFNLQSKQEKILREINLIQKIHYKALKDHQSLEKQTNPSFESLKDLIETNSMIKSEDYIVKKVNLFIKQLQKIAEVQKFPSLDLNSLILNQFFDLFKYIMDYNFDFSQERVDRLKSFRFKLPEFSKIKTQQKVEATANALVPIIAKNRRMMVYDVQMQSFRELMLSEIHSIPQGNQIVISKNYPNKFFIVGGHMFKNPQGKIFELDQSTQEFFSHNSMETPRWMHQTVAYKNFIYVFGGTNNEKEVPINTVERFNIDTQKWENMSPMKFARHSFVAVLAENLEKDSLDKRPPTIFIFGGIGENGRYIGTIEKYDIQRNSWSEVMTQKSYEYTGISPFGIQINNSEILLFGGLKYLNVRETQVQDPTNTQDFILYPFNGSNVYLFNMDDGILCLNNFFSVPMGIQNTGNQLIFSQKKIHFSGNLNTQSFYNNLGRAEFTDSINAQKMIGAVSTNKFEILDYILFQ